MRSRFVRSVAVSLVAGSMAVGVLMPPSAGAEAASAEAADSPAIDSRVAVHHVNHRESCAASNDTSHARCHAQVNTDVPPVRVPKQATTGALTLPTGFGPSELQSAYNLKAPSGAPGSGPTVAIVDAYDDPTAEADLAAYRSMYGLGACTSADGCFSKVNQNGASGPLPAVDTTGWAEEISLDLDMVSATCPNCKILLVEANTNGWLDLFAAVDAAAALHPSAISNSYGSGEWNGEAYYQAHYNHPGIAVTVSSGDAGYGVQFPAASTYVTAVGGTSLARSATFRGWSESAWTGAGAGCSQYISKPSWQHDSGCPTRRTVADVAAVADPATGVAVYDTYNNGGWLVFGGTSVAAPIIASVYALKGNSASITSGAYSYSHLGALYDVRSGSDGTCAPTYLCTAGRGYDGPTGNGTPNGLNAF